MSQSITFTIPGVPVPWARARRNGKRYFNAGNMTTYKKAVAWAAKEEMGRTAYWTEPCDGPVAVQMSFAFPVPNSWPAVKQQAAWAGDIRPTNCDIDNLQKAVSDALNKIVYQDDRLIAEIYATKRYSTRPGATVTVRAL